MARVFSNFNKGLGFIFSMLGIFRSEKGYIAGVCQGLSERFNWNVHLVRLVWVISPFITLGTSIILYLLLTIVMPKRKLSDVSPRSSYAKEDYIDVNSREL